MHTACTCHRRELLEFSPLFSGAAFAGFPPKPSLVERRRSSSEMQDPSSAFAVQPGLVPVPCINDLDTMDDELLFHAEEGG